MFTNKKSKITLFVVAGLFLIILTTIIVAFSKSIHKSNSINNLYSAIEQHDYNAVDNILTDTPQLVNNNKDISPLLHACTHYDEQIIRLLVSKGANINQPFNESRIFPINRVLQSGDISRFDTAWFMIENGAEIEDYYFLYTIVDSFIESGDISTQKQCLELMKYALSKIDIKKERTKEENIKYSLLEHAAAHNCYMVVEYLLDNHIYGINDHVNTNKDTALMIAISHKAYETASLLILRDIDVNYTNVNGITALYTAVFVKDIELVKLLLDNGADATIKNNAGVSAYDLAVEYYNSGLNTELISAFK